MTYNRYAGQKVFLTPLPTVDSLFYLSFLVHFLFLVHI